MRIPDQVQDRIRTLLQVEFDRRLQEASQRLPQRCQHNHRQVLDTRKQIEGAPNDGYNRADRVHLPLSPTIGLCLLGSESPETWAGTICEDPIDAQMCPQYTPMQTKANLLLEFREQVENNDWLRESLPTVYELLWVLESTKPNFHLPWWKRLGFWFLRLRTEPVRVSAIGLLPPGDDNGVHGA